MISSLRPPLQNSGPAAGVLGSIREHLGKNPLADVVRTGACDKDAPGPEQAHGPVIDFLVSPERSLQALLIFSECRRIQDDRIVAPSFFMAFPQEVERIRLDAFDIGEPIPAGIRPTKNALLSSGRRPHASNVSWLLCIPNVETPYALSARGSPLAARGRIMNKAVKSKRDPDMLRKSRSTCRWRRSTRPWSSLASRMRTSRPRTNERNGCDQVSLLLACMVSRLRLARV